MALTYFDSYLDGIVNSPAENSYDDVNAFIAEQWHNSNLLKKVCQETYTGSFEFEDIEVWLNTVSDFTSAVIKNSTDFRRIMFKDNRTEVQRGRYYKFDKNYWLTYEDTTEQSAYAEILVRRCNNIAKWIDEDTGEIIEQPCVLDYTISATNPKVDKDIITANSSVTVILQGNEKTHKLKRNQRFIFNGVPYKFVAYNNYMQDSYVDKNVTLLFMDCDFDLEKPTDDIENNIADRYEYNYEVVINNAPTQQTKGFSSTLTADVLLDGQATDKSVRWESNRYVTIDQDGNYTLTGDVDKVAQITAKFGSFEKTVNIEIVDSVVENKEIIISTDISELKEKESIRFDVSLYIDGDKQDNIPTYVASGADTSNYILTQSGNIFTLVNVHKSKQPLHLIFSIDDVQSEMDIQLKALF